MVSQSTALPRVRLAEVVAALSLATDLATGQPLEHGLRRALLAVWLGEDLGLSGAELSTAYYVALLGTVGCTIEGAAMSAFFKDEIALGAQLAALDPTRPLGVAAFFLARVGEGDPPLRRAAYMVDRSRTPSVQKANRRLLRAIGFRRIPAADLARIAIPTTLIWGRHDRVARLRGAQKASARYRWPLHVIEDAGHIAPGEQPKAFLAALHTALGTV